MKYAQSWTARRWDPNGQTQYAAFPAEVPGNVQYDYAQSIGLTDLQYGSNVRSWSKPKRGIGCMKRGWSIAPGRTKKRGL